jgi:hypothetical protein
MFKFEVNDEILGDSNTLQALYNQLENNIKKYKNEHMPIFREMMSDLNEDVPIQLFDEAFDQYDLFDNDFISGDIFIETILPAVKNLNHMPEDDNQFYHITDIKNCLDDFIFINEAFNYSPLGPIEQIDEALSNITDTLNEYALRD